MTELTANDTSSAQVPGRTDLGRLARGGLLNLIGAASSAVFTLAFVIAMTHVVARADVGVFLAATSIFLVLSTLGKFGANIGTVYFVARLRALGEQDRVPEFLRAAVRPVVVGSVCLAAATAVLAPVLASLVLDDPAPGVDPLRVLAVFIPLAALSDVCLSATRGFGILRALILVEKIGRPIAQLLLLGIAIIVGWTGPVALSWVWAVPYLPAALIAFLWMVVAQRNAAARLRSAGLHPAVAQPAGAPSASVEFWRFSIPQGVASLVQIVLQRLDIILLAAMRGPVEAAIYGAVTRVLVVGQLGGQALIATVQPALSGMLARHDMRGVEKVYQASTGWLVLSTWPLYLFMVVHHSSVPRVFGHGYSSGAAVVLILCSTMLLASGVGMVDVLLSMSGRTRWIMGNTLAALTVNVVLNLTLIPRWGIVGSAVAWAAAITVNNLVPLTQVMIALRVQPFGTGFRTAVALTTLCFGAIPLLGRARFGESVVAVIAEGVLGLAIYLPCLWLLRRPLALTELRRAARGAGSQRSLELVATDPRVEGGGG
jgi:O-antigen/teichoic acid export membrane protein